MFLTNLFFLVFARRIDLICLSIKVCQINLKSPGHGREWEWCWVGGVGGYMSLRPVLLGPNATWASAAQSNATWASAT